MGGGLIAFGLKKEYHIALRISFFVFAAACFFVSIFYPYGEYFGINGFYGAAPKAVGLAIVILPEAAAMVGGYFLFRNCSNKNMWIVFYVVIALLLIGLLAIIPNIKDAMRRPRYRFLAEYDEMNLFHNWWEPTKNYKDIMIAHGMDVENSDLRDHFKSYPSGHTAETSILIVAATFFPMADTRFQKYQLPIFGVACAFVLWVALARIMAAAHFLSDVSWGATIIIALTLIANEVLLRFKKLQAPEEATLKKE